MALDLDALQVFVKVAELGSFTRAADQLGMPKARVSLKVKALEAELGSLLLQRSTRVVRLTGDGEQLLVKARRLVAEAEDLGSMFQSSRGLNGRVRIDLPVNIARDVIIPRLPELLARHPGLQMVVSTTDRRVEAMREGVDCLLRAGPVGDEGLVGRKIGVLQMMNYASPAYLRRYGVPARLEDLDRHYLIHYSSRLSGEAPSFEYPVQGGYAEWPMRSLLTVNNVDAYRAACAAGLGIMQVPRNGGASGIADGALVEVLPELTCAPMAISLLQTHGRNVPRRVRAVMTWLAELLVPRFEAMNR